MSNVAVVGEDTFLEGDVVRAKGRERDVLAFLGVPYAQPPVGPLRFQAPRPAPLRKGSYSCRQFAPVCPQEKRVVESSYEKYGVMTPYSEDCLYLNVWTPHVTTARKLPVMVYIHGGAFRSGMSNHVDGSALAAYHDVVFVSINYRLGIFGFMCTGDGHVRGNMGLLDQLEALRWIKKHIQAFNGDPDNVTVMGNSAGGMSVGFHLVSPLAKGLFHKAVCQSGSPLHPGSVWTQEQAKKFLCKRLRDLGCHATDGTEIIKFLNTKSSDELAEYFTDPFPRVLDGTYLVDEPLNLYRRGLFHPVHLLIGFTTDEGLWRFNEIAQSEIQIRDKRELDDKTRDFIDRSYFRGQPNAHHVTKMALDLYSGDVGARDIERLTRAFSDIYGDLTFKAPTILHVDLHSTAADTFLYHFDYRPSYSTLPGWVVANHSEDIHFLLGRAFFDRQPLTWSEQDVRMCRTVMKYFVNFATSGDPNAGTDVAWPKYEPIHKRYLVLRTKSESRQWYRFRFMDFWNRTVPDVLATANPGVAKQSKY